MTGQRDCVLQEVLGLTQAAVAARVTPGSPAARAMRRVEAALRNPVDARAAPSPRTLPACAHLEPALVNAARGGGDLAKLAGALRVLAPQIAWRQRPGVDPVFMQGHANADLVGTGSDALEQRDDVWLGLSLMAPGITYPDHQHPPEEAYLVLSEGDWRQGSDAGGDRSDWHTPGLGGIVYNRPGIVHAMRSGSEPLLAIWCLPIERHLP